MLFKKRGFVLAGVLSMSLFLSACPESEDTVSEYQDEVETALIDEEDDEALGPEDCFEFETFDPEDQSCVLNCDTDDECLVLEERLEEAMDALEDAFFSEERVHTAVHKLDKEFSLEDSEHPTVRYEVKQGKLAASQKQLMERSDLPDLFLKPEVHRKIWDAYQNVSSPQLLKKLAFFDVIYDDSDQGNLAAVVPVEENAAWLLEINLYELFAESDTLDVNTLRHNIIHEFTHILTLENEQLDFDVPEEECPNTFWVEEGCTTQESYLNHFVEAFWEDKIDENHEINAIEDPEEKEEELALFFEAFPDTFLTTYAATNPVEDIAESFTAFVIKKQKPTGSSQADQKVAFFYDYPELVRLREQMRRRTVFQEGNFQSDAH